MCLLQVVPPSRRPHALLKPPADGLGDVEHGRAGALLPGAAHGAGRALGREGRDHALRQHAEPRRTADRGRQESRPAEA